MKPQQVAIVTAAAVRPLHPDDLLLRAALEARGADAQVLAWDDPAVDWSACECAVLRSTWNYHLEPQRFARWLDSLDGSGTRLVNPAATIRWNMHKRYLRELAQRDVPVVDTLLVDVNEPLELLAAIRGAGWSEVVVKPAVSASAHLTWRLSAAATSQLPEELGSVAARVREWIVQPFVAAVTTQGELSAMCIDGEVTHVVRKLPRERDFRVQAEHGGRVLDQALTREHRGFIAQVLDAMPVASTYARIDWVAEPSPRLMEVELIEPELFLTRAPHAAERLAAAVSRPREH